MSKRFAAVFLCLLVQAAAAERPSEPGLLLRAGNWGGDAGTFLLPPGLAALPTSRWPGDGWHRLRIEGHSVMVTAEPPGPQSSPPFLAAIAAQVAAVRNGVIVESASAPDDELFLRVGGAPLASRAAPAYVFRNGTTSIRPELDRRYELQLGDRPFAFTVHNGRRSSDGRPYGGAHVVIEIDGETHEYLLGEHGWDATIEAIADLDGDGKPDFIVRVGGANGDHEAVLLSSRARPGRNPATASLVAVGC